MIAANAVCKRYPGGLNALRDVTFTIDDGKLVFITGHSEYSPYTLNDEYMRDLGKGLPINKPRNYYRNNDPAQGPVVRWRGHANLLFTNWLNYYVYQETPFRREDIKKLGSL